jgi:hypothetical protein
MLAEGFNQFIGYRGSDLAATLSAADRSPELDLSQRQDGKSMPSVACGKAKEPLCTVLINIQLDQGTRFQVVERQVLSASPAK